MNNLTKQEAFVIAEFINEHVFNAIKQDEIDDIEWLATLIHGYEKLSSYSDYNHPYANETEEDGPEDFSYIALTPTHDEPKEDESNDPGVDPWTRVYFALFDNYRMLRGCYDARNGDEHYMYGVESVMEIIAEKAGRHKQFSDVFSQNMKKSLEKAGKF